MSKKCIVVPIANQQDAIDLSVSPSTGLVQSYFGFMCTTNPDGGATGPATHCLGNGEFEDTTIALFQATAYAQVKEAAYRSRTAQIVLAECSPQLYVWVGP